MQNDGMRMRIINFIYIISKFKFCVNSFASDVAAMVIGPAPAGLGRKGWLAEDERQSVPLQLEFGQPQFALSLN